MSDIALETIDYPITFGALNINDGMSAAGVRDTAKNLSQFLVTRFDPSPLQYRNQKSANHLLTGGDVGLATRVFRYLSLAGEIVDTTPALLADREAKLRRVFDLEESQYVAPTTLGQQTLDFYSPTGLAPSGFSSPVRELYFCRPSVYPMIYDRRNRGLRVSWALQLECADPSRYLFTASTATANAGNSWSVAVPNWDAAVGAMTWPVIRINTTTGAHAAAVSIRFTPTTYGAAETITLDLSESGLDGTHTVDIDMRTMAIIKDGAIDALTRVVTGGTRRADLRTTDVDTFWGIPANGGTMLVSAGTSNLTSVVATYRQCRG